MIIEDKEMLRAKVQEFVSTQSTYHIDAFDMEDITEAAYGVRIEMLESPNDTTHEYQVTGNNSKYDKENLNKAISNGHMEYWNYRIILNDLCAKGVIEKGNYFLRMSW